MILFVNFYISLPWFSEFLHLINKYHFPSKKFKETYTNPKIFKKGNPGEYIIANIIIKIYINIINIKKL